MPKRILDDSLLDSRSLEVLSPRAQDAFPRFILLADDFGCFEVNARVLWARGWSRRPDVSEADVAAWITEYAERQAVDPETGAKLAPVLMLWTHVGRRYAHLTGWTGPHGQKKRAEYDPNAPAGTPGRHGSRRKTPPPPADLLAAVLAGDARAVDGKPPGTDREPTGNEKDESLNDSTPARELTGTEPGGNREPTGKCEVPGPAVPVPVAVPVAQDPPLRAGARARDEADPSSSPLAPSVPVPTSSPPPAGPPRPRLVSPYPPGQDPAPNTTAVLAALHARGIPDAAPPSARSEATVEAVIASVGVEVAVERLATVLADPGAQRCLTYHTGAIRGVRRTRRGDLGCDPIPWHSRLAPEQRAKAQAELNALGSIDPDLASAPLGIRGNPDSPAYEAVVALNERWMRVAEARA